MVDLYVATKKYDEAINACREFLEIQIEEEDNPINQEKPFMLEKQILATAKKGKIDDALKMTEKLIEKDEGGWYFVRLKADIFREAEKYGDAADSYLETIDRLKKSKRLEDDQREAFVKRMRYILSGVYVDMKNVDKGAEQLQILLKDDPDNPTFLNDLGFIWADHDLKIEVETDPQGNRQGSRARRSKTFRKTDVDSSAYMDAWAGCSTRRRITRRRRST